MPFLPKPNVLVDDPSVAEWPRTIRLHPSQCDGGALGDYGRELSPEGRGGPQGQTDAGLSG